MIEDIGVDSDGDLDEGAVQFFDSSLYVGWQVPDFFHHLPVRAADHDELVDEIADLASELFPGRSREEQFDVAVMFLAQTAGLIDAGAQYAGMCFVDFDGRPSMATVTAQRVEREPGDVRGVAEALAGRLARHAPEDDVEVAELACGPVVLRSGVAPLIVPAEVSPDSVVHTVPRRFAQAHIPLPDDLSVQMLELSTLSVDDWDAYAQMFAQILDTVEWATDDELQAAREQRASEAELDDEARLTLAAVSSRLWDLISAQQSGIGMSPELDRMRMGFCSACRAAGDPEPCEPEHRWVLAPVDAAEAEQLVARVRGPLVAESWSWASDTFSTPGHWHAARALPQPVRLVLRHSAHSGAVHVTVTLACRRRTG
ncbi:hypothetical protein ACIREE_36660 [Streptomyces sp. NPDC102467]|uniref:hypothetical protein n=1 Tax=Streptomyces sp. NPDC102467 TaxID=3366179 RepID=UPI00380F689F